MAAVSGCGKAMKRTLAPKCNFRAPQQLSRGTSFPFRPNHLVFRLSSAISNIEIILLSLANAMKPVVILLIFKSS